MKTYRFFLPLLVTYCGWAVAAEQSDRINSKKLPHEAVLICGEHVIGDASGKSMHIEWQAFGLKDDIDKTAQFYQAQFGEPPARDDVGRYIWRFKGEYSELIFSAAFVRHRPMVWMFERAVKVQNDCVDLQPDLGEAILTTCRRQR